MVLVNEDVYNGLANEYDLLYAAGEFKAEDTSLFRYLERLIELPVLDVGCGTGLVLEHLDLDPKDYYGVEPSQGMADRLHEKFPEHGVFEGAFEHLLIPTGSTTLALYGSASYVSPSSWEKLKDGCPNYFLMFYAPGYTPVNYGPETVNRVPKVDYAAVANAFPRTYPWHNYVIASNLPGAPE